MPGHGRGQIIADARRRRAGQLRRRSSAPGLLRGCGRRRARMPSTSARHVAGGQDAAREAHLRGLAHAQARPGPTPRTSPARPTSPKTTVRAGSGPVAERGRDRGRHPEVGRRLRDLAARRPRSRRRRRRAARGPRASRARPGAGVVRLASRPMAMRRGVAERGRRDQGLHLDQHGPRALDGGHHRRARASPPGARTGTAPTGWAPACRPVPVISNTPSSETAPKRFLTARTMRWCWCFSPSK